MGSAIISGCGKLNSDTISSVNEIKLNIIKIPANELHDSTIVFLSPKYVTKFSEFLDAVNYYYDKGLELYVCGGEYMANSKFYIPVSIYYDGKPPQLVKIKYKKEDQSFATSTIANISTPPTDWSFYNIKDGV